MLSRAALGPDSDMLDGVRTYLRLEFGQDDPSLNAIMLAAIDHAEDFTRQIFIRRDMREVLKVTSAWLTLTAIPVVSVLAVTGIPAEGSTFAIPASAYAVDIDSGGVAHLQVMQPGAAGRVEVRYRAGLASSWAELPESLRLGILRLVGHYYAHRDAQGDAGPPAAVAALLRPWRRLRLS
jgi:uncharacterized phiE125 gp8 family phage protein